MQDGRSRVSLRTGVILLISITMLVPSAAVIGHVPNSASGETAGFALASAAGVHPDCIGGPPASNETPGELISNTTFSNSTFSYNAYPNATFYNNTFLNDTLAYVTMFNDTFSNNVFFNNTFSYSNLSNDTFSNGTFTNNTFVNNTFVNDTLVNNTFAGNTWSNNTFVNDTSDSSGFGSDAAECPAPPPNIIPGNFVTLVCISGAITVLGAGGVHLATCSNQILTYTTLAE